MYWQYLKYILRHKWFVFLEACKLGIPFLGLVHDWSKFLPDEFLPFANHVFKRDATGYYKPIDTGDPAFDYAWFLHQSRNKHHWQYWFVPDEEGGMVMQIPLRYCKETLADWYGAGRAQGTPDVQAWYAKNKNKLILHAGTRQWVESSLSTKAEEDNQT